MSVKSQKAKLAAHVTEQMLRPLSPGDRIKLISRNPVAQCYWGIAGTFERQDEEKFWFKSDDGRILWTTKDCIIFICGPKGFLMDDDRSYYEAIT